MRVLNEKYLKKFIRKFWLQSIPETCEKPSPGSPGFIDTNAGSQNAGNMFGVDAALYNSEDDDDKYNSVEDGLHQMSSSSSIPPSMTSTTLSTSPSKKQSSRPYYKSHRRQPSYSNVDLIFLEVRKWPSAFFLLFLVSIQKSLVKELLNFNN